MRIPSLTIIFGRLSVFTAGALTFGGIAALLSGLIGMDPLRCFTFGSFVPLFPLIAYFSSAHSLRRAITAWRKMADDGIITDLQFKQLRAAAVAWHKQRWYGESALADVNNESSK